jgi:hypothetical protein
MRRVRGSFLKGGPVGAVSAHAAVQRSTARKEALLLGLVHAPAPPPHNVPPMDLVSSSGAKGKTRRVRSVPGCPPVCVPDEAHELGHAVAVVVGRPEGVLRDGPTRREDHKVARRHARRVGLAGQHREDGRILRRGKTKACQPHFPHPSQSGCPVGYPGVQGRARWECVRCGRT